MPSSLPYAFLADLVLAVHLGVVAFVVGGLAWVLAGYRRNWRGARTWSFRLLHLGAIAVVAAQAWLGIACPLTTLEMGLRGRAGQSVYGESFIGHWMQALLYIDAPLWVFTLTYTVFGLLVAAVWIALPPHRRSLRTHP